MDIAQEVAASLSSLLRLMVDKPNEVSVSPVEQGEVITFRVSVSLRDMGKVIGKQGRTARSLRIILGAISMSIDQRLTLEIVGETIQPHLDC